MGNEDDTEWNDRVKNGVEESLYGLCERLPRLVRLAAKNDSPTDLKLLLGYLSILGPRGVKKLCHSQLHLEKFMMAMFQTCQLHNLQSPVVQELSIMDQNGIINCLHGGNEETMALISEIFRTFGSNAVIPIVTDYLLTMITSETSMFSSQSVFVMNHILMGFETNSQVESLTTQSSTIIDTYVDEMNKIIVTSDASGEKEFEEVDVTRLILLLDGVGNLGEVLCLTHPAAVTEYHQKVLYSIISLYLSYSHWAVQQSSLVCLKRISNMVNRSVPQLIQLNLDCLKQTLLTRLQHFAIYPRSPMVLIALLKLSFSVEMFNELQVIIKEILVTLDIHYMQHCKLCLYVLLELVKSINSHLSEFSNTSILPAATEPPSLEEDEEPMEKQEIVEEEKKLPLYVEVKSLDNYRLDVCIIKKINVLLQVVKDVLHRTKHFLSSPAADLRLITLDILNESLKCLIGWTDELLPLIHQNWPGLSSRFSEHLRKSHSILVSINLQPAIKAFKIICTMAHASGDFVYRRVKDDVLPALTTFMESQWTSSLGTKQFYQHSDVFKLQLNVLQQLGQLCVDIRGSHQEYLTVAQICGKYFHSSQPPLLTDAAVWSVLICLRNPNDMGHLNVQIFAEEVSKFESAELYRYGLNKVYEVMKK